MTRRVKRCPLSSTTIRLFGSEASIASTAASATGIEGPAVLVVPTDRERSPFEEIANGEPDVASVGFDGRRVEAVGSDLPTAGLALHGVELARDLPFLFGDAPARERVAGDVVAAAIGANHLDLRHGTDFLRVGDDHGAQALMGLGPNQRASLQASNASMSAWISGAAVAPARAGCMTASIAASSVRVGEGGRSSSLASA